MAKIVAILMGTKVEIRMTDDSNTVDFRKSRIITLYDLKPTDKVEVYTKSKYPTVTILRGKNLSYVISFDVDKVYRLIAGNLTQVTTYNLY